jgi:hypothetical protein
VTTPELYSTDMRTVGHAMCVAFSKFGAFCSPFMVISSASNVTVGIVLCAMNVIGAVAANFLPDTTGTLFSCMHVCMILAGSASTDDAVNCYLLSVR